MIRTRLDTPAVDPRFSAVKSSPPVVHTPYLPANSLGADLFPRPTTPATQRWPTFESSIRSTLGGHFDDETSPTSPLLSSATPTRRGISIAELVDEENSSPGTLGGVNAPRPTVTCTNVSSVHSYPPLSISIIDVTPGSTESNSHHTWGSQIKSLLSSPSPPPETPDPSIAHAPGLSQSRAVSPASDYAHVASEGGKSPHRSKRETATLATHEVPEGRVTRSNTKRKAADNSGVGGGPSKRMKPGPS